MDIEEMKKYSQNKIEADNLIKQVRQQIKETTWEKQNLREGFTETFKPLISQFEDPGVDSKKQNIFTQNQEMLQNQLALTQGIRNNQLALKGIKDQQGHFNRALEYLENKADMEELPGFAAIKDDEKDSEDEKDDQARAPLPKEDEAQTVKTPIAKFSVDYLDRYLNNKKAQEILKGSDYENLPSYYFDKDIDTISSLLDRVNQDAEDQFKLISNTTFISRNKEGYQIAKAKAGKPQAKTKENIFIFNTLSIYAKNLSELLNFKKQFGSGLFDTPQELLHRFELLNGSLAAGNNGVLPEFIQIAHRLRDLGILSNNQLNKLLRKVI